MTKLPARYNAVAIPLLLSMMMSFVISGISTWRAIGFVAHFLSTWVGAWLVSWPIAFAAVSLILPLTRRIVGMFVEAPRPH